MAITIGSDGVESVHVPSLTFRHLFLLYQSIEWSELQLDSLLFMSIAS